MALPDANTTETYDVNGIREDLTDLIYMIDPTETPFLMMAGRGSCKSTRHDWQMDHLSAAGDNAARQGFDATYLAVVPTERVWNYTQICQKGISVTGTVEVVNKAGRNSEMAYQLAKRSKEIKRDIEWTNVGDTGGTMASVVPSASVAGRSGAVQAWFHANSIQGGTALPGTHRSRGQSGADGGFDGTVTDAPTDGTQRAFLETHLKSVIQGAWKNGGDPTIIMAGAFNKSVISGFTGHSTRFDRGEDKRLVAAIDVYVSDFGEHRVVPNRFQRERDVFVFTPELWEICYLRPFRQHALAKTGDAEQRQLLCEWTLEVKNHAGSGIIADLATS